MKILKDDCSGHIFSAIAGLFIIAFILMVILFLNVTYTIDNENNQAIASDNMKYISTDYIRNIDKLSYDTLEEISNNVIITKTPLKNSNDQFKKLLNEKLEEKNKEYLDKYDVKISSNVISIESSDKPEYLIVKVYLNFEKADERYRDVVEVKTSVLNLKDPLGILLCSEYSDLTYNESRVLYKNSLSDFLNKKNVENYENYINATAPLIIKKCPYDPYIHHGDGNVLYDCIKNGYYHESSDGSCYLCRLEAKPVCSHYGFETFIIPHENIKNNLSSVSAPDHVVFFENYFGNQYSYFENKIIFIDNAHKLKYGL